MERKIYTVKDLIETLQQFPEDALVIVPSMEMGYASLDFVELFKNEDILIGLMKKSQFVDDPIRNHNGDFVYLDNSINLLP